jgi:hypothetical protein
MAAALMRRIGVVGLLTIMSGVESAATTLQIDQSNTAPPNFGMTISWPFSSSGQTFVPQLSGVDFVTLALSEESGNAAPFWLNLRQGTITSPVIASSNTVLVPAHFGSGTFALVDLVFSTTVPLIAGLDYVLEFQSNDAGNIFAWGVQTAGSTTGRAIVGGPYPCCDHYFVEGIFATSAVPELGSFASCVPGLVMMCGMLRWSRRKHNP